MAQILDPVSAVAAKVSAAGAIHITAGGDGFPTFLTAIYVPRITVVGGLVANSLIWGMRASPTKTIEIRSGQLRLSLDTATTVEVGFEAVRFNAADLTGGTLSVARPKNLTEGAAATVNIRAATAIASLGVTGAIVEASANALMHLTMPFVAGASVDLSMEDWSGLLLAPGDGLCLRTSPTALPVGASLGGWLEFSER